MFTKFGDNRLFDAANPDGGAGGGAADDINLDGFESGGSGGSSGGAGGGAGGGQNPSPGGGQQGGQQDGAQGGQQGGGSAGGANDNVLIDIDDKTDKFTQLFLSDKYSDLNNVKLDKDGNVVNLEGDILVKKEDLLKSTEEVKTEHVTKADAYIKTLGTITVGDEELPIEEDGTVKDKEGNVILTAEQLRAEVMKSDDYLADPEEFTSIYDEADAITGFAIVDDKGNKIDFEETPEGLAQRELMLVKQEGTRVAQTHINNFFGENPDILDAFYYKKANGSLDGFGQRTNHEGVTVDKDNAEQQFDLVVESEVMRGKSKEAAVKYANLLKANDMLYETASDSLTFMQQKEKDAKAADRQAYEAAQKQQAEADRKYWNDVKTLVDRGRLLDYNIPENIRLVDSNNIVSFKTKEDFFNYLSTPVQGNRTQAQLDAMNEPLEMKLFYDLLRFTGNNLNYVVNQRAKQSAVNDAKKRFNTGGRIPAKKVVVAMPKPKSKNDQILM